MHPAAAKTNPEAQGRPPSKRPHALYATHVIYQQLGAPDAVIVETSSGQMYIVADPSVSPAKIAALQVVAEYLPTAVPRQGRHADGVG